MTNNNFVTWLLEQIEERDVSYSEVARTGGISHGRISQVISGDKPGWDFCEAIARAFNLPAEIVFQKAGLLPSEPEHTSLEKEAVHLLREMSPERRQYILTTMRALATGTPAPASRTSQ